MDAHADRWKDDPQFATMTPKARAYADALAEEIAEGIFAAGRGDTSKLWGAVDAPAKARRPRRVAAILAGALAHTIYELQQVVGRIKELEQRPAMKYCGVWSATERYTAGSFVTDKGSLWVARIDSISKRPGDSDAFTLAAKRGRDGKDGRSAGPVQP